MFSADLFAQGCSQCRLIPESSMKNGSTVARTLNPAILYLMAVPYLILFIAFRKKIFGLYKSLRRRKVA
jgi:hypothetical protein